jgi:hypothetical protein
MAQNLARLEQAAWPIFRAGHVPMIGEWVALPVLRSAGADWPLDPFAVEVMYPTAERLLEHCDAVLRLPGESTGADQDVRDRAPSWNPRLPPGRGPRLRGHRPAPGRATSGAPRGAGSPARGHRLKAVTVQ